MGFDTATAIARTKRVSGPAVRLALPAPEAVRVSIGLRRAAMLGNFPPRKCGLATFTRDTFEHLRAAMPQCAWRVIAMQDAGACYDFPKAVTDVIPEADVDAYVRIADDLNRAAVEIVFIQHEFGIFGGDSGAHVLAFMRRLRMPAVVTLHTVLEKPSPRQKRVLDEIIRLAAAVIVMSETGAELLARVHKAGPTKVHVIPHGAPERPFVSPEAFKKPLGLSGRPVVMTFGLLSPNKGIETVIRALPAILERHPDAVYMVVGATHPHLLAREGEAYRQRLMDLAASLGVVGSLRFENRFVEDAELIDLLQAADIYCTPYLTEAQVTSGTLSYAVALGKPVVSTPYWHAAELLADGIGILCPFGDWAAFGGAIAGLLDDESRRLAMARRAYRAGESSRWRKVAEATIDLAIVCRANHEKHAEQALRRLARPKLDALFAMADDCGVFQHSRFGVPDRRHGYCTDDNARALALLARMAGEGALKPETIRLARTTASFVSHAWNPATGRFRNFMGYDRVWLDEGGSDDCCARALESLSLMARHWPHEDLRDWAADLAREAFAHVHAWPAMRARALVVKACSAAAGCVLDEDRSRRLMREAALPLVEAARQGAHRTGWFEPAFAYDNARLPEALIVAGDSLQEPDMLSLGLDMLDRLMKRQTAPQGWFSPIATSSFDPGATHRQFDQQPIEALATIDAAFAAWRATGEAGHVASARLAFDWFGGRNVHALPLARADDGVCFDGLTADGVNRNHGAESILSYHLAALAMRALFVRLPAAAT